MLCIFEVVLTKVTRNKEKLWNRSYYKTLWFSVMKLIHTFGYYLQWIIVGFTLANLYIYVH